MVRARQRRAGGVGRGLQIGLPGGTDETVRLGGVDEADKTGENGGPARSWLPWLSRWSWLSRRSRRTRRSRLPRRPRWSRRSGRSLRPRLLESVPRQWPLMPTAPLAVRHDTQSPRALVVAGVDDLVGAAVLGRRRIGMSREAEQRERAESRNRSRQGPHAQVHPACRRARSETGHTASVMSDGTSGGFVRAGGRARGATSARASWASDGRMRADRVIPQSPGQATTRRRTPAWNRRVASADGTERADRVPFRSG